MGITLLPIAAPIDGQYYCAIFQSNLQTINIIMQPQILCNNIDRLGKALGSRMREFE